MFFWILISFATTAIAVVLLLPLLRSGSVRGDYSHDMEVYKDQLAELDRDEAGGLISGTEAAYARAEIGRRLLAASEKSSAETVSNDADNAKTALIRNRPNWVAIALIMIIVPVVGIGLYRYTGQPTLRDQPLQERMANVGRDEPLLLASVENRLMKNPEDGKGWDLVAPIYFRIGRFDDAQNAFANAIRILGPSGPRLSGLGETMVASQQGMVSEDARKAFEDALKLEPNDPKSRFYVGLALEQENKKDEALAAYNDLVKVSPPDAPWLELVNQHIAIVNGTAPAADNPNAPGNPTAADVQAAQGMAAGDRDQMIRNMVAGLDEKLKADPNNFDGWMRLVRSYAMLKDTVKAQDALTRALAAFPATGDQGKAILAQAKELGLKAPEGQQ